MRYARSRFRDFESCLRFVVGLDEEGIQLILKQYNSNFVTVELSQGIYLIKDISESVYSMADHGTTPNIEYDDITLEIEPNLTRFRSTFARLRFDEKSVFSILLGFTLVWDCKPSNAIHSHSRSEYTSDKFLNLNT